LRGKKCIEVGGTTEMFESTAYGMPLYPFIEYLDGANLFNNNPFPNQVQLTFDYEFRPGKIGHRHNVDVVDLDIIDKKYDVIISSHVIEHIANPIKAIFNWKKILNKDGLILSIIPDKRFTFDHKRPLTSYAHLIEDFLNNTPESDDTHIEEQILLHDWNYGGLKGFNEFAKDNEYHRVVHHHTFNEELVKQMFNYCGVKTMVCYFQAPYHIVHLGKI